MLTTPLVRAGEPVAEPDLAAARELVASGLHSLPWEGLNLSARRPGDPDPQISAPQRRHAQRRE